LAIRLCGGTDGHRISREPITISARSSPSSNRGANAGSCCPSASSVMTALRGNRSATYANAARSAAPFPRFASNDNTWSHVCLRTLRVPSVDPSSTPNTNTVPRCRRTAATTPATLSEALNAGTTHTGTPVTHGESVPEITRRPQVHPVRLQVPDLRDRCHPERRLPSAARTRANPPLRLRVRRETRS